MLTFANRGSVNLYKDLGRARVLCVRWQQWRSEVDPVLLWRQRRDSPYLAPDRFSTWSVCSLSVLLLPVAELLTPPPPHTLIDISTGSIHLHSSLRFSPVIDFSLFVWILCFCYFKEYLQVTCKCKGLISFHFARRFYFVSQISLATSSKSVRESNSPSSPQILGLILALPTRKILQDGLALIWKLSLQ